MSSSGIFEYFKSCLKLHISIFRRDTDWEISSINFDKSLDLHVLLYDLQKYLQGKSILYKIITEKSNGLWFYVLHGKLPYVILVMSGSNQNSLIRYSNAMVGTFKVIYI